MKYNVGHQVGVQWVFGGYDVVGFMVLVDRRDAATLLPVICQHIVPGTTIISALGCLQIARYAKLPASYSEPHLQLQLARVPTTLKVCGKRRTLI